MSPHRTGKHQILWGGCPPHRSHESPRCDLWRGCWVGARQHHEAEAAQRPLLGIPRADSWGSVPNPVFPQPSPGLRQLGQEQLWHTRALVGCRTGHAGPWAALGRARPKHAALCATSEAGSLPVPLAARCPSLYAGIGQAALSQLLACFCMPCAHLFPVLPLAGCNF